MKEKITKMINFIIIYNVAKITFMLWGGWVLMKKILYVDYTFPGNNYYPIPGWIVFVFFLLLGFIFFITSFIYLYMIFLLFFIFIAWLVIKYIVPIIYIFFIPFPPFFAPIPLRYVILENVPPFKDLTEAGILPLMERLLYKIISGEVIRDKTIDCFGYIFDFIKINVKNNIKKNFPNVDLDSYFDITEGPIEEIITENKIIEENKNEYYQKAIKIINAEYENCYNNNKQLLDNLSEPEIAIANIKNEGIKIKCYSESISSYVKANY